LRGAGAAVPGDPWRSGDLISRSLLLMVPQPINRAPAAKMDRRFIRVDIAFL